MAGKRRISKRLVDDLLPTGDRYVVWDTDLPAFGIEVLPSGVKSYRLMYRYHGRARKLTLGRHGAITPDEARQLAKLAFGSVAKGDDPAGAKTAERRSQRFSDAYESWLSKHVDAKRKPSTREGYHRLYEKVFKPHFGTRKLADVTRADISSLHRKFSEQPYQANRLIAILRSFFNWCERQGWRPENSNPARLIERFRETSRERLLTSDELGRLGKALRAAEAAKEWPWSIAAIRLLLFTGARRGEILGLRWAQIDIASGVARLEDSKTGAKTLYFSAPARAVLADLESVRQSGNPFVICGAEPGAPLQGLPKFWQRIRVRAGLADLRLHDLRHAFASSAALSGESLTTVGKMLGHSQPSVTNRYSHFASEALVLAADRVGDAIAAQLDAPLNKSDPTGAKS